MMLGKDNVERLPPPVGTSDWATFSRDSYCVDKTLLIKELIDTKTRVALFTRPRRFGKTTAMRMIRVFLSGLNNLEVRTVFDEKFSQYFGFTEDEVEAKAKYYGAADKISEIKRWYDGYDFAGREIYNPWSVLQYFKNNCKPDAYWLDTSSNDLITELVRDLPRRRHRRH